MAKRLTEIQKKEIFKFFNEGKTVNELSNEFNCTKLTITRNLKKYLGEKKYKEFLNNKSSEQTLNSEKVNKSFGNKNQIVNQHLNGKNDSVKMIIDNIQEEFIPSNSFVEIEPLDCEIEESPQKDLSSIPISDIDFPNVVYMIVDKKIELETKYLKDYPEWGFLSQDELRRKTIQIFYDLKIAKRFCSNDQKVIKVPNTNVFKVVAPILRSKGISRIVSDDKLLAL